MDVVISIVQIEILGLIQEDLMTVDFLLDVTGTMVSAADTIGITGMTAGIGVVSAAQVEEGALLIIDAAYPIIVTSKSTPAVTIDTSISNMIQSNLSYCRCFI